MITPADLAHWRHTVPWDADEQVEQDLVLSRLIVEIANHPFLGQELLFRGGTCFHKLWLDRPWRYSEDLDYVRRTAGGVGEILSAIREVADIVGFDRVQTDVRRHPKARLDSTFVGGGRMRIKIEMNTFERSPAAGLSLLGLPTSKRSSMIRASPATSLPFSPGCLRGTTSWAPRM